MHMQLRRRNSTMGAITSKKNIVFESFWIVQITLRKTCVICQGNASMCNWIDGDGADNFGTLYYTQSHAWRNIRMEKNLNLTLSDASLFMEKNEMKNSSRLWKIYAGDAQCNITHTQREEQRLWSIIWIHSERVRAVAILRTERTLGILQYWGGPDGVLIRHWDWALCVCVRNWRMAEGFREYDENVCRACLLNIIVYILMVTQREWNDMNVCYHGGYLFYVLTTLSSWRASSTTCDANWEHHSNCDHSSRVSIIRPEYVALEYLWSTVRSLFILRIFSLYSPLLNWLIEINNSFHPLRATKTTHFYCRLHVMTNCYGCALEFAVPCEWPLGC